MRRWAKFGGLTVGAGLLVGFIAVAWLFLHRSNTTASSNTGHLSAGKLNAGNNGNAIPLTGTPTPSPYNGLEVTDGGGQGSVQGAQTTSGQGESSQDSNGQSSSSSDSNSLPDPSGFGAYDKYATNADALYIDTQPGTGTAAGKGSVVTVEYTAWLTNGTEFDAATGENPYTFTIGSSNVIVGFQEGVFGMKVGGERRIIVPPSVGYGSEGKSPEVPANAVLVFDVTLVNVK